MDFAARIAKTKSGFSFISPAGFVARFPARLPLSGRGMRGTISPTGTLVGVTSGTGASDKLAGRRFSERSVASQPEGRRNG
jgi:hypothetical protein